MLLFARDSGPRRRSATAPHLIVLTAIALAVVAVAPAAVPALVAVSRPGGEGLDAALAGAAPESIDRRLPGSSGAPPAARPAAESGGSAAGMLGSIGWLVRRRRRGESRVPARVAPPADLELILAGARDRVRLDPPQAAGQARRPPDGPTPRPLWVQRLDEQAGDLDAAEAGDGWELRFPRERPDEAD